MMKNSDTYAVAVRKSDGEIIVEKKEYKGILKGRSVNGIPLVRGVVNFIDSLVLGMSSLTFSASFFEEEADKTQKKGAQEGQEKPDTSGHAEKRRKKEDALMGGTVALSIVLAVALFMVLPYWLSTFFRRWNFSEGGVALAEGLLRIAIFFAYEIGRAHV